MLRMKVKRLLEKATYPNDNSAWLVCGPDLEIGTFGKMVEKELEEVLGLFVLEANDAFREALVDIQRLLTRGWVDADKGVL